MSEFVLWSKPAERRMVKIERKLEEEFFSADKKEQQDDAEATEAAPISTSQKLEALFDLFPPGQAARGCLLFLLRIPQQSSSLSVCLSLLVISVLYSQIFGKMK